MSIDHETIFLLSPGLRDSRSSFLGFPVEVVQEAASRDPAHETVHRVVWNLFESCTAGEVSPKAGDNT